MPALRLAKVVQLLDAPQGLHACRFIQTAFEVGADLITCKWLVPSPDNPFACCRVAETGSLKARMRAKAARALVRYTQSAIEDLKGDEDEMLRGA